MTVWYPLEHNHLKEKAKEIKDKSVKKPAKKTSGYELKDEKSIKEEDEDC